jgi:hypothetical protein
MHYGIANNNANASRLGLASSHPAPMSARPGGLPAASLIGDNYPRNDAKLVIEEIGNFKPAGTFREDLGGPGVQLENRSGPLDG